jgi:gliding motility-associated-like protein
MTGSRSETAKVKRVKIIPSGRLLVACTMAWCFAEASLSGQVISNSGAVINIRSGIVIGSRDILNGAGGTILNEGEINLSGNFTSTANTSSNGLLRIGGNWTNTGGILLPGTGTVIFNGAGDQMIARTGGETFNNLTIANTGSSLLRSVNLSDNVNVTGILNIADGNINSGASILFLSNFLSSSLNYTSTTASRIIGKFERNMSETATYLFPLGSADHYNPVNIKPNSISVTGSLLSEFHPSDPGNGGLPLPDPPVEISDAYPGGFWSFNPGGFSSPDFNISLDATGFLDGGGVPDTITDVTRLIKRESGGNWSVDGAHVDAAGAVVSRSNLGGDFSPAGTEFALGRSRPLITAHPVSLVQCEHTDAVFGIVATGAGPLTYRWYKDGAVITNDPGYSGTRSDTLTILDISLADAGTYYCIVTDRHRKKTRSNDATLTVNKRPVATATPSGQAHECSNIAFDDIVLGETYGVPGTSYVWTRDNPTGITSAIPLSGTVSNIGDALTGMFNNTTDAPLTVTFTITPVGPAPTYCVGLQPITATVRVNPTPRATPVNNLKQICYGGTTEVRLESPTTMTRGTIEFDYTVTRTSTALTGDLTPGNNLPTGHVISRSYQNSSDTLQSVSFNVTPKNTLSGCNSGPVVSPAVKVHPEPLRSLFISVPFTCEGGTAGELTTILAKGSKPNRIHWTGPLLFDSVYYTNSNTDKFKVRYAGIYKVDVRDSLGCAKTLPSMLISGAVFKSELFVKQTDTGFGTSCRDTSDGVLWVWEEPSTTAIPPFEFWLVYNETDTIGHDFLTATGYINRVEYDSLPRGHYVLHIRDFNGCYNGEFPDRDIVEPDPVEITFDKSAYPNGHNVSCLNYNDGSAGINTIAGGNGSYHYKWSTSDGLIQGPDTLESIDTITAGTYYLLTTDLHGCPTRDTVTLTEPEGISMTSFTLSSSPDNLYNIGCAGSKTGSIKITLSGGSGNFNYSWTGPDGFTASTRDISNLGAGVYRASITDQLNSACLLTPVPEFTLTEPGPLTITDVKSISTDGNYNIDCIGGTGSIDITITGGSPGARLYTWSTTNGTGIVAGQEDQPSLTAGTYRLSVTDANSCIASADITLTEPGALSSLLTPSHVTCLPPGNSNGSINLTPGGGVGPYQFTWSNGATTEDISGLAPGNYSVIIRDVNNCLLTDNVRILPPPPLQFSRILSVFNGYNVRCLGSADGSIDITPTSGLAPFIYSWQKEGGGFVAATEDISGLGAGRYFLTITDANNCQAADTIQVTQPGKLSMTFQVSSSVTGGHNINCAGARTGSINAGSVNNAGGVNYLWSDGNTSGQRQGVAAGDYSVIITDANGCVADSSLTLTEPEPIKTAFEVRKPLCPDMPDGEITVTASGGIAGPDYTYRWSNNSAGRTITNILGGEYKISVTDLNGCTKRDSMILEPLREICLVIPNAITPDGDLINDEWNIGMIELYPLVEIKIFNRWGELVWKSERGYPTPWNGRSNGTLLPIDSYHYIIDLNNGSKPYVGNVTIVR